MTETTWKYLEMIWDDEHHGGDTSQALAVIQDLWPDFDQAAHELAEAYIEVDIAMQYKKVREALITVSENYRVGGLPYHLQAMQIVLVDGLKAISLRTVPMLQRWFKESDDVTRKARIAGLMGDLGNLAADCVSLLLTELADSANPRQRHDVRCASAYALGKLDVASPDVVKVLMQVAGDTSENQALRSYCIEALMDLGPAAKSSIPTLTKIFYHDEDEDLRHFAWAALKSVRAATREHPCGGTFADHMRSLYRTE